MSGVRGVARRVTRRIRFVARRPRVSDAAAFPTGVRSIHPESSLHRAGGDLVLSARGRGADDGDVEREAAATGGVLVGRQRALEDDGLVDRHALADEAVDLQTMNGIQAKSRPPMSPRVSKTCLT